jgi:murein DD-endopeptidase MepM/ murein hydrolase activator NlpD
MAKKRYQYDPRSLKFVEVRRTARVFIVKGLSFLSASIVIAALLVIGFFYFFDSPKEKMLKREVKEYEIRFMEMNKRLGQIENVLADVADRDDNIYRVIFEAEPIPADMRRAGFGGVERYSRLDGYTNSEILIATNKKLDQVTSQLYVQSRSLDEVYKMARNKADMLASIPAIQPVSNKDLKRLSSFYGLRTDPIYKVKKFHEGVDFSAPKGTEIYSTGDGVVVNARKSNRHYGNTIKIDHGYGYVTVYAHMEDFSVKKGEHVKRGQVIGTVGNTGKSTAPHLHYEVRKNGRPLNPIHYFFNDLTPEEYEEVLVLSQRPTQSLD